MDNKKECKCTNGETCKRMMDAGLQKAIEELKKLEATCDDTMKAIHQSDCAKGACQSIINAVETYECSAGKKLKKRAKKTLEILREDIRYESKGDAATKILVAEIEAFIQD